MSEETSERLAEVEAAARDARDWIVEFIDRVRAGQPLDLEPLTLAHQRLEGLNLGDGERGGEEGDGDDEGGGEEDGEVAHGEVPSPAEVGVEGEPVLNARTTSAPREEVRRG